MIADRSVVSKLLIVGDQKETVLHMTSLESPETTTNYYTFFLLR